MELDNSRYKGWTVVKMAAAMANTDVGKMKPATRDAIIKAGEALLAGKYHDQFKVEVMWIFNRNHNPDRNNFETSWFKFCS